MKKTFTYEEILATLVPEKNTYGTQIIGRTVYGGINPETVIKIALFRGEHSGYIGLTLAIINKRYGQVDSIIIPFPSYTNENQYVLYKSITRHTAPANSLSWDSELTTEELQDIHKQINDYINMFDALPDNEYM